MLRYFILLLLAACKTTTPPQPKDVQKLCASLYDPHLCIIVIDDTAFAGHGSNKCLALRKLRQVLVDSNHNPLLTQRASCGRVFE